jgi:S-DNA-T family DNA segregation ATPase FtsK/SpoIIIE
LPVITKVLLSFGPVSNYDIAVKAEEEQAGLPDFSPLNLAPTDPGSIAHSWEAGGESTKALIGVSRSGPFSVDISRDGPHGIIGGATGSGKSQLLQTIVLSLAVANRPDAMTFMLVDYKGGTTFRELARLPHTVGMVTDLDTHLTNRVLLSLAAEVRRREYLLSSGRVKDFKEYGAARSGNVRSGRPLTRERLPRLLVLIDEFAALAAESDDFVTGLADIARRGRSLGIHMILATQRPAGTIPAEIQANSGIRVALRMLAVEDSVAVIEADNAAHIAARIPGRAYVRAGALGPYPIQVSMADDNRARASGISRLTAPRLETWAAARRSLDEEKPGNEPVGLSALVAAIGKASRQAGIPSQPSPWLPPLPETLLLGDLTKAQAVPGDAIRPGVLAPVVYGLSDFPAEQAQRAAAIDFASFGHMLAAGAASSGKSQLLRTIAGSIATAHSCADVHIYVIDGGNGTLSTIAELPHCGAVVSPSDTPRLNRLIGRLSQEISLRRELLARSRFGNIGEQRAAVSADQRLPHIVLMINRWEACIRTLGEGDAATLTSTISELLSEGTYAGLHLVLTGSEALISSRMAALARDKLAFRMEDRDAYLQIGLRPRNLPTTITAGRAFFSSSGIETQVALLDGEPSEDGQAVALRIVAGKARQRDAAVELSRRPFQVDMLALVGDRFHVGDTQGRPVGREDILAWLRDRHASGASVALLGPRRAGKTWLLAELKRRLVRDGATRVHDVVIPPPSSSIDTPDALAGVLDRELRGRASPAESLLDEAKSRSEAGSDRLVFLLDEVGRLVDYDAVAVSWLRSLSQAGAWMVYTGTEKDWHQVVRWALTVPGSSFGNDVNARPVGQIEPSAALTFLTGTAANLRVNLAPSTAAGILELTGAWPFYLQVAGDAVVRRTQDQGPVTGREALRRLVEQRLLDEWTHHFQTRWAEIGSPGRAALLAKPGAPPGRLSPAQRDDLRVVGLLRPGDVWLDDLPFFDWIARNAASLQDGERQR